METTGVIGIIWGYRDYMGFILGLYWDNGKENGNYRDYRDYIGLQSFSGESTCQSVTPQGAGSGAP